MDWKFEIFGSSRRISVRRRVGERMVPQCETSTVKHGGGSVMVWGCFAGSRVGDLYRVRGTLNQNGYHSILQRHAIPSGMRLVGQGFILQQDNDPKHKSKLCQNYLRKKEQDGKLENMEWPAQSPDLNPIELVWDELGRRVKAKQHTSATHLWELLQQIWEERSEEYLISIVERMPRVCSAVISAKGGYGTQPQSIMDPPPCLTIGKVSSTKASPFFLHKDTLFGGSILVLSVQSTFLQKASGFSPFHLHSSDA